MSAFLYCLYFLDHQHFHTVTRSNRHEKKENTIPESDDDASFVNNSDYSVLDKSHTQQTLDGPFDVHKSESEHSIGETNESKMISHNTLETSTNTPSSIPKRHE